MNTSLRLKILIDRLGAVLVKHRVFICDSEWQSLVCLMLRGLLKRYLVILDTFAEARAPYCYLLRYDDDVSELIINAALSGVSLDYKYRSRTNC